MVAFTAAISSLAHAQADTSWRQVNREAIAAYRAKDYRAYRDHIARLANLVSGHPQMLYKLASAHALAGDRDAALAQLRMFAATGLTHDAARDTDFVTLRADEAFKSIVRAIEANRKPVSTSVPAFTLADSSLLPEDIVYDRAGRAFYLSSMKRRKIVRVDAAGRATDFTTEAQDGVWSVLALAVDHRRRWLWATISALPQMGGFAQADSGRAAVVAYDIATRTLARRVDLRVSGHHELGELAFDARGDLYVSDGRAGTLYVLRRNADSLVKVLGDDVLVSPQGIVPRPDGRLFLADYTRGIGIVDPARRTVEWMAHPDEIPLSGIDGLTLVGRSLIAVQNGTTPRRIVRLELDEALRRVTGSSLLESNSDGAHEPNHGTVAGGEYYFIANSGWDVFDANGSMKSAASLRPAVVRKLSLAGLRRRSVADTTRTKAELMAVDRRLAADVATRGQDAVIALLEPDAAVLVPRHEILQGPGAAATPLRTRYDGRSAYRWVTSHAVASIDGRFGCTVGTSTFRDAADTSGAAFGGRLITCWRRTTSGAWRIVARQHGDRQVRLAANVTSAPPLVYAPGSATVAVTAATRDELVANEISFATMGRSTQSTIGTAFAAFAAEDGLLMARFDVVQGRRAIEAAFADWPATSVLWWEPDRRFGGGRGGLAFTVGPSFTHPRDDRTKATYPVHFLSVWRQDPDGRWAYIFDLGAPR